MEKDLGFKKLLHIDLFIYIFSSHVNMYVEIAGLSIQITKLHRMGNQTVIILGLQLMIIFIIN